MITGELESFVRGRGHDLYRIRGRMPGTRRRRLDWKATAKKSMSLKVREFTRGRGGTRAAHRLRRSSAGRVTPRSGL